MYSASYGNFVACRRGARLHSRSLNPIVGHQMGCTTTIFHVASVSLRLHTSWSRMVGGGVSSRNGLTHCWVVSKTGQSQLKRLNPASVPSIHISDANMAERALRLFCPFLGRRFVIVCTYPPYSVLSVQILRHSDPRDYTIYGLELFNEKSGHAQT